MSTTIEKTGPFEVGEWNCYTSTPAESRDVFEAARSRCPVAHSSGHDGFHMLLNYKDVRRAMADHRTFSSEPQVLRPMLPRKPIPALEMDPPRHGAWRAIFNKAVTPKAVAAMEPFVRADVRRHLKRIAPLGRCDIVHELCEPVPAETICHLVGVDEANVPPIRDAAIAMFAAQGEPEEFGRRQAAFGELTVSEVHARRDNPRDDFLTSLADIEVEGRKLQDDDYVVLLAAFLGAGHHSTTSGMASLFAEVLSRPELVERLRQDPSLIPIAVEESLRLRPPFYGFYRRTTDTVDVEGVEIPAGGDVYVGWAAANQDPSAFTDPDRFSLDRENNRHMSFGFGIHNCPGAPLARMEMRVALEELLAMLPDARIAGEIPDYCFGGGDYTYLPELEILFTPLS
jgi:cytochrome P450